MNSERFNKLVDELRSASLDTLAAKNAKYAVGDDRLHNFRAGAEVMGGTPAQAAWGYATKHLVALRDKIQRNDFRDRDDLLEKCQDIINYICFIWCIGNEACSDEVEKEEPKDEISGPKTYRDMVARLQSTMLGTNYIGGVAGCPGEMFRGAPRCGDRSCYEWRGDNDCADCWNQPYKGEELISDGEQE